MTKGTHLLRSALLALLALAVISGGSFAAGDLFDDDYKDCPTKTRLRDGQISDLTVARDSDEEDEVNVSWVVTDPASWGLGANAYSTSLVAILDDGELHTKTLSLGTSKATFDGVTTGTEVTVQLAIVVDTADGDYLISDILEASVNQSLTAPAFMATSWMKVTTLDNPDTDADESVVEALDGGALYYVGYNENFGNYKADGLTTRPSTSRLRIGLAHSATEDGDARDDVDFDAYIVRITDEGGDVVPEGDDVATVASAYGDKKLVAGNAKDAIVGSQLINVRINDGGDIQVAMQDNADTSTFRATIDPDDQGLSVIRAVALSAANDIYAEPPDEHRDFPIDVLASDETYTFEAWAVNDDGEVISPVASLTVRPIDEANATTTSITDYLDTSSNLENLYVTEFTVLK